MSLAVRPMPVTVIFWLACIFWALGEIVTFITNFVGIRGEDAIVTDGLSWLLIMPLYGGLLATAVSVANNRFVIRCLASSAGITLLGSSLMFIGTSIRVWAMHTLGKQFRQSDNSRRALPGSGWTLSLCETSCLLGHIRSLPWSRAGAWEYDRASKFCARCSRLYLSNRD